MNAASSQPGPGLLTRRRVLGGGAVLAGACCGKAALPLWSEEAAVNPESFFATGLLPQFRGSAATVPALAERYPWTHYGERSPHALQLANAFDASLDLGSRPGEGFLGERRFQLGQGRAVLPWAPMFERPTPLFLAPRPLRAQLGVDRLFIKDEGSDRLAIYGNKVRKYEFLMPNLYYGGVRTVSSHGAYGSNHCAHLALAARFAAFHAGPAEEGMQVVLHLYPQAVTDNVRVKLRLLAASGASMKFLEGDAAVGLSIKLSSQLNRTNGRSAEGYIDPGGSSPLSVLGHVEAAMELARQIESGGCELDAPPDVVFLPIGTGGTAMGLALGFHLLGWPTRVIATCSQDKSLLARLVVNGDIGEPFDIAHAGHLLAQSLPWAVRLGLVSASLTADEVLRGRFGYDNDTWRPAYGRMSPEVARHGRMAAEAGLILDGTFSAKAFHTLAEQARSGLLSGRRVLFWNTYQRFPFETLLSENEAWMDNFPKDIRSRLVQA